MKVPKEKPLSKDAVIKLLREEIVRKDGEIERLRKENSLLLNVTYKNAKRRVEEIHEVEDD
ncbi:hypothetical protein KO361_01045 [Candidatus Woesearchaeota archaeon]|nr:hypothetical protein [Candidatus Woesearchaeota archaeon]